MPVRFATRGGGGENISIGLKWSEVSGAKSYALLFDDKHPVANNWVHWLVTDIPATVTEIPEGVSRTAKMPVGSRELITSWGRTGYDGPQPPVGSGDHEYVATLFALDVEKLEVSNNVSRNDFLKGVGSHTIAKSNWSGWLERK
ncbi:MAG: YbhB/YbcL family Raf kinase inhibitor-like protein [Candidatus Peregrinibacteria bacterium]